MSEAIQAAVLLLAILNPFALSVYLIDIFRSNPLRTVAGIVTRAALISGVVFSIFACTGEAVFARILQVRFAAFQVFGGLLFLIIALRFMLSGSSTLVTLRGEPEQLAGTVAMPFMVGPGTVSAATMAGLRLQPAVAVAAIWGALACTGALLVAFKLIFDWIGSRDMRLTERYVQLASRVSAMAMGAIAVEMTLHGLEAWVGSGVQLGASWRGNLH
ncbi:MAG: MarC family protein [Deltaproteobacteria bacterium]